MTLFTVMAGFGGLLVAVKQSLCSETGTGPGARHRPTQTMNRPHTMAPRGNRCRHLPDGSNPALSWLLDDVRCRTGRTGPQGDGLAG